MKKSVVEVISGTLPERGSSPVRDLNLERAVESIQKGVFSLLSLILSSLSTS